MRQGKFDEFSYSNNDEGDIASKLIAQNTNLSKTSSEGNTVGDITDDDNDVEFIRTTREMSPVASSKSVGTKRKRRQKEPTGGKRKKTDKAVESDDQLISAFWASIVKSKELACNEKGEE